MKPLSKCYETRKEPTRFILDLIGINARSLLVVSENKEDDSKVIKDFEVYLHTYMQKNNIGPKLPEQFLHIKVNF